MKRYAYLAGLLLVLSVVWLSGCGASDQADFLVINDSKTAVGFLVLEYPNETHVVSNADGHALLEQGDNCGLDLEQEGLVTVILSDLEERELARSSINFTGHPLTLTLSEDGVLKLEQARDVNDDTAYIHGSFNDQK